MRKTLPPRFDTFSLAPGRILAGRYEVNDLLGAGWEGEVYSVIECRTGIPRAAKIFFPQRNLGNRATRFYARKMHKLRHCPILTQYHTHESTTCQGVPVSVLVSEFVDGDLLGQFIKHQPGQRLTPFEGLHLLHALSVGVLNLDLDAR